MSDDAILRFAQGIKAREDDARLAANENFWASRNLSPDQAGEANILARGTTLPVDVVQRNLPAVKEGALSMLNRQFVSGNPKLAAWASNPAYAAVAKDDIGRLDKVSRTGDYMTAAVAPKPTVWNYIKGVAQSAYQGAGPELYYGIRSAETDLGNTVFGHKEWSRDPQTGRFNLVDTPVPAKSDDQLAYERARAKADEATPDFKSWYARSLYGGLSNLAQMAPGIVASVATANPGPALAMGSAQATAQGYGDIRAAGGSPTAAGLAAPVIGTIEAATEFLPTQVLTKGLVRMKAPKVAAEFFAKELLGEEVATVTQNAVQTAATPGQTWGDYLRQLPADMRDTAVAVAVAGTALHGVGRLAGRVAGNANEMQAAAEGVNHIAAVDAMMTEAAKSKTRDRDPEAFSQFIAQHTDGTPAESLYVPAEKLRELYQSERFNPEDPAHQFLADFRDQVDQAAPIGGDVVIPMKDAVTHLAGSTAWDAIRGDVRVSPGGMSENEARQFESEIGPRLQEEGRALDEEAKADEQARAPERMVHDEVAKQLREAGFTPDVANAYATLYAARYATRGAVTGTDAYTAFKKSGLTITQDVGQAGDRSLDQSARGRIDLFNNGTRAIRLFEHRDLSTFLHESGHLWLEELKQDATEKGASPQLKADWKAVQEHFKANGHKVTKGNIQTEAHELFARTFERYAMEGKAPSTGLRAAFQRFRAWLTRIYRVFDTLKAPINDDIRGVMDRLLATQDEINVAAQQQHLQTMFNSAAEAGMSDKEFEAYRKKATEARDEAFSQLLHKTMEEIRRQRTKEWKAEERSVREGVAEKINARPEFQALHLLRTGKWLGDSEREGVKAKLDREWLKLDGGGEEALGLLPSGTYSDKDTMNADDIAELTGFKSGGEMVRALIAIETAQRDMKDSGDKRSVRERLIDEETAATMRERYGDPLNDGSIEEEALAAVHNEKQGELIASEGKALSKRVSGATSAVGLRMAREWARRKIGSGKVADVASRSAMHRYARAAAKASQAALKAVAKGDMVEAYKQKQSQLLNHALLTEAKIAADEVDSAVKRLSSIVRRRTITSVDQDYLDRAHGLLEKFDFAPRSQKSIDEQISFSTWADAQRANGVDILTPPRLADNGEHYTRISVDELRSLRDSVEQIVQLGRLKQKLMDGKEQRDFDEVVAEAVDGTGNLKQRPPSDLMEPAWKDRFASGIASADAALLKMEQVFDWLDQGNAQGVFNRIVFRPLAEAQDRENDLTAEYLGHVKRALNLVAKGALKRWDEKVTIPTLLNRETGNPWVFTRQQLVSMALNMGNAGNIQRLTDGYGWNEQAVRDVLNANLDESEWHFVQTIWDLLDTLWPHISEMERRINGFAPEKVAAVPVETPFGTLAGGYFPAVYDTTKSLDSEANAAKSGDLFETTYTRATTRASAANERVEKVSRPILLHLGVINRHLGETIHDITHREAVMNADKFLSSKRVMAAVDSSLGPEIRKQFRPWLKFVANRWAMERAGNEGLGKFLNKARANATIVGMGFRISTMLTQIAGYSNSAEYVGMKNLVPAIASAAKSPIDSYRFVAERSGEVRHRMDTLDRDIGLAIRNLSGGTALNKAMSPLTKAKEFAFHGIGYMDRVVTVPTWIAGYNKALAEGKSEEDAIYEGDKAVRLSQGAGSAKDLAAVQRGTGRYGEVFKLLTMFYSYMSAFYQRERTLGRDIGQAVRERNYRMTPQLLARAWWLVVLPPVLTEVLAGRGPDDDDDWAWWAFEKMLVNLLGPLPIIRDIADPALQSLTGGKAFTPSLSPIQRAMTSPVTVLSDVHKKATGQETEHATRDALELAGYSTGLVPGQLASATQFLVDVGEGDQDPQTVGEWYRGLTTGKAEKK